MKKRILFLLAIICMLALVSALICACDDTPDGTDPDGPSGGNPSDGEDNPPIAFKVYFQVSGGSPQEMTKAQEADAQVYAITVTLAVGDHVLIFDSNNVIYNNYVVEFDGAAKIAGEYVFTVSITGESATVHVDIPKGSDPITPEPTPEPTPSKPKDTKVTVYYSNSEHWSNVYVYMWNYKSSTPKAAWPGEKLTTIGTNDQNEKQYSVTVDYSQYDRIIFNDGATRQTKDLIVGSATSGYYGADGVFTMNEANYGKVQYFTLKDTKNLSYIANNSKKISVYTPAGYSTSKKYGVLYMFDSQNLYIAAAGAEKNHDDHGSWAVDVAVTNLVKNGGDGIIIVAIDNADIHRDSELTMSQSFGSLTNLADSSGFYNGKLDELGNFMKETLMPYIAQNYSVDTSREKTGIAGSSSGGLAAYYLGLRDNDLYGYIGALSPANGLFTTQSWNKFYAGKDFSVGRPKVYVYCGNSDWLEKALLPGTKAVTNLKNYGFAADSITEYYLDSGEHNESFWRIVFLDFLSKML